MNRTGKNAYKTLTSTSALRPDFYNTTNTLSNAVTPPNTLKIERMSWMNTTLENLRLDVFPQQFILLSVSTKTLNGKGETLARNKQNTSRMDLREVTRTVQFPSSKDGKSSRTALQLIYQQKPINRRPTIKVRRHFGFAQKVQTLQGSNFFRCLNVTIELSL